MVCAQLRSRDGFLVEHACRSAMLHYRSTLLHTLTTFTFSPMLIFGSSEEKQYVALELFGNFEEDQVSECCSGNLVKYSTLRNVDSSCKQNREILICVRILSIEFLTSESSGDRRTRGNSITAY